MHFDTDRLGLVHKIDTVRQDSETMNAAAFGFSVNNIFG